MCPFCIGAAATWVVTAGVASTGGLALFAAFRPRSDEVDRRPEPVNEEQPR